MKLYLIFNLIVTLIGWGTMIIAIRKYRFLKFLCVNKAWYVLFTVIIGMLIFISDLIWATLLLIK